MAKHLAARLCKVVIVCDNVVICVHRDFCYKLQPNYVMLCLTKQTGRILIFATEVYWWAHGIKLNLEVKITSYNFSYRPDLLLYHRLVIGLVLRGPFTLTWRFPSGEGEITPKNLKRLSILCIIRKHRSCCRVNEVNGSCMGAYVAGNWLQVRNIVYQLREPFLS